MKKVQVTIGCLFALMVVSCAEPAEEIVNAETGVPLSEGEGFIRYALSNDIAVYAHPDDFLNGSDPVFETIPDDMVSVGESVHVERIAGREGWLRFTPTNPEDMGPLIGKYVFNGGEFPDFVEGTPDDITLDVCRGIYPAVSGNGKFPVYDTAYDRSAAIYYAESDEVDRVRSTGLMPPYDGVARIQINGIGEQDKGHVRYIEPEALDGCVQEYLDYASANDGNATGSGQSYVSSAPPQAACSEHVAFVFDGPGPDNNPGISMRGPDGVFEDRKSGNSIYFYSVSGRCIGGSYEFTYSNDPRWFPGSSAPDIESYSGRFSIPSDAEYCSVSISKGFGVSVNVFC